MPQISSNERGNQGKLCAGVLLLLFTQHKWQSQKLKDAALPHVLYSPDLAPSDFYLFPKVESHLWSRRFESDNNIKCAVERYLQTSSEKGSQSLNIGGQSALKIRVTVLKNKNETIYL